MICTRPAGRGGAGSGTLHRKEGKPVHLYVFVAADGGDGGDVRAPILDVSDPARFSSGTRATPHHESGVTATSWGGVQGTTVKFVVASTDTVEGVQAKWKRKWGTVSSRRACGRDCGRLVFLRAGQGDADPVSTSATSTYSTAPRPRLLTSRAWIQQTQCFSRYSSTRGGSGFEWDYTKWDTLAAVGRAQVATFHAALEAIELSPAARVVAMCGWPATVLQEGDEGGDESKVGDSSCPGSGGVKGQVGGSEEEVVPELTTMYWHLFRSALHRYESS